jgi:hypothetical protein
VNELVDDGDQGERSPKGRVVLPVEHQTFLLGCCEKVQGATCAGDCPRSKRRLGHSPGADEGRVKRGHSLFGSRDRGFVGGREGTGLARRR